MSFLSGMRNFNRVHAAHKPYRGVAGQRPRVVCERFLENNVHAAQSAAGREAPLRPAGGLGGRCKPPRGVRGSALENFENPENLPHKKQYFSGIFNHQPV